MVAAYPPRIEPYPDKRDFVDPIWARHFNNMQEETRAVQATLGVNPHIAVADPAGRTPNYGTVASRIRASARHETLCSYRGYALGVPVTPNLHARPALVASEDSHDGATETGYRLPETGYWMIVAKVDWTATVATQTHPTIRSVGIEINNTDYRLSDSVIETSANRENLTTHMVWQERLPADTDIGLNLRAANTDTGKNPMPANVYLRVYLVRCMREGDIKGLPILGFTPEPPPPKPKPKPGNYVTPTPTPSQPPISPAPSPSTSLSPARVYGPDGKLVGNTEGDWPHVAGIGIYSYP